jgi:site-specific recombinase XerD
VRASEAIDRYEAWMRAAGRSPETLANAATYLSAFCRAAFGDDDPPLRSVTAEHVQHWLGTMRDAGRRDSSMRTALSTLSAFLRWCERQGLVDVSPMRGVMRPSFASSVDDDYAFLDDVELDRLLHAARHGMDGADDERDEARRIEDFLLCALMGLAGLRVSEVCALDAGDVGEDEIVVRSGKGRRARRVPTDPVIWEALQRHRPAGRHLFGMAREPARRLTRNALAVRVRRLGREAGLAGVTPHALRHSFATNTWRATQELVPLRDLLGHRSTATTNRYTHSRAEERRAVLAQARLARQKAIRRARG